MATKNFEVLCSFTVEGDFETFDVEMRKGMHVPNDDIFPLPSQFYVNFVERIANDMAPRPSRFAGGPWSIIRVTNENGASAKWATIYPHHEQTVTDWKGDEYTLSRKAYALALGAVTASAYSFLPAQKDLEDGRSEELMEADDRVGQAYRMLMSAGLALDPTIAEVLD